MTSPDVQASLPPLPPAPRVSAFMPARNAAGTIEAAIRSIRRQPEVTDIVVALGPSEDATGAVLAGLAAQDPRLRIVDNPTGRIPSALNLAWRATEGDVLVRVDAHSVLPDGYVSTALDALRDSGAANVGGVQRPVADSGFRSAVAVAMSSPAGSGGAMYRGGSVAGEADTVFLGVFRRDALERVGGYDERFDRNEDAELNIRLRAAGYRVWFTPDLMVDYLPRGDVRSLARQYFANGRWRRLTVQVHPHSVQARQLVPAGLAGGALASAGLALTLRRRGPLLPLAGYAALLLVVALRVARDPGQAFKVALALATMHLSFGVGFLVGPPSGAGRTGSRPPWV